MADRRAAVQAVLDQILAMLDDEDGKRIGDAVKPPAPEADPAEAMGGEGESTSNGGMGYVPTEGAMAEGAPDEEDEDKKRLLALAGKG